LSEEAIRSGRPVLVADAVQASLARDVAENLSPLPDLGPVMALPLSGAGGDRGAVVVGRRRGSAMFTEALAGMASTFADHAAVALELAEARRDQARMTLLEDRARIARDLHDHVIQQLFAAGMTVQAVSPRLSDEYAVETLDKVVDHIDAAIKQIRTSIFQLRPNALAGSGLRTPVLEVVAEVTPALGLDPWVHFLGPVDAVSDEALAADVTAVVREALTNAAKHAQARRVEVRVRATTTELVVSVEDDGVGLGPTARRSGLENLRSRAARRNGTCEAEPGADAKGTRLVWTVPLGAS
jgi:signal transduction histidine kinase